MHLINLLTFAIGNMILQNVARVKSVRSTLKILIQLVFAIFLPAFSDFILLWQNLLVFFAATQIV